MPLAEVIDREIFFNKLVDSVIESYDKDLVGHSVGMRNLHVMVLSENYEPERFERAQNLSIERAIFLGEVQAKVETESTHYLYFL
jgi:hypothetical protein